MRAIRRLASRAVILGAVAVGVIVAAQMPGDATAQQPQSQARRPWFGVSMDNDGHGPRVKHVVRTSPADKAGVHDGDRVLRVDATRVTTPNEVIQTLGLHAVGDTVPITLLRTGHEVVVRVELAPFPGHDAMMRMDHVGAFAPAWKGLQSVSGTVPRNVGDLRGKVVVVDFWATWCVPCRMVAPKLSALQARYGAQGLSVVGISNETIEDVAGYAQRGAMRYGVAVDKNGETTEAYTVLNLPTLFVIDKRGVIRDVEVGYDPSASRDAQLEALVKALIAEPAPTD